MTGYRGAKRIKANLRGDVEKIKSDIVKQTARFDGDGSVFKTAVSELRKAGHEIVRDRSTGMYSYKGIKAPNPATPATGSLIERETKKNVRAGKAMAKSGGKESERSRAQRELRQSLHDKAAASRSAGLEAAKVRRAAKARASDGGLTYKPPTLKESRQAVKYGVAQDDHKRVVAEADKRNAARKAAKSSHPATDLPKVADAVPHKGTRIPKAPAIPAGYEPAGERAGFKLYGQLVNPRTGKALPEPLMMAVGADGKTTHFAHDPNPSGLRSREKLASFLAGHDGKGQAEDLRLANKAKPPTVAPTSSYPVGTKPGAAAPGTASKEMTAYQKSLQAPDRQASFARDGSGKLAEGWTSKSKSQIVEEAFGKGLGKRGELRGMATRQIANLLKYKGVAGLAVAAAAAAFTLARPSAPAQASPAKGSNSRTTYKTGRQHTRAEIAGYERRTKH